jgi:outer membrane cobalamin receptor
MPLITRIAVLTTLILNLLLRSEAQVDTTGGRLYETELSDLINSQNIDYNVADKVSISGQSNQDVREAAGSILIITSDQIQASGARDITELLCLLPSFNIGRDVDDVMGIGSRGLWAHEGKILVMLNGITLNEFDFGTFGLGQRISLDNVSRIEIINGPGSVVYGGFAAIGVINIITFKGGEKEDIQVSSKTGFGTKGLSRNSFGIYGNNFLGNETFLNYSINHNRGVKSQFTEKRMDGQIISYGDSTKMIDTGINIQVIRKNINAQVFYDDYTTQVSDAHYWVQMKVVSGEIQYDAKLGKKSTLKTKFNSNYQIPWSYFNTSDSRRVESNTTNVRHMFTSNYFNRVKEWLTLSSNLSGSLQTSSHDFQEGSNKTDEKVPHQISDLSLFTEANAKTKFGNLNVGIRFENNTLQPFFYAPRFGYSVIIKKFHTKINVAKAFKIPTIENVHLGPDDSPLKGEDVWFFEWQTGYRPTQGISFLVNLFSNKIRNPIVYAFDNVTLDNYVNRKEIGTLGGEFMATFSDIRNTVLLSYSYYQNITSLTDLPEAQIDSANKMLLGMPAHKVTIILSRKLGKSFAINYSQELHSDAYAYETNKEGELEIKHFKPTNRINISVNYTPKSYPGFMLKVGCNNFMNVKQYAMSPYNNGLAALPMSSREFRIELNYSFKK